MLRRLRPQIMRSFATHSELPAATVTADSTIPAVQCDAAKRLFAAFATDTPDVRVGRGWFADDLRRKSFEDLHKLWYVLQIERNRLETIRRFCTTKHVQMPNYQRLGKVRQSMARIKFVIGERSRSYNADKERMAAAEKSIFSAKEKEAKVAADAERFEADKAVMIEKLLAEESTSSSRTL